MDTRKIAATLRRCSGQFARPLGVSGDDVREAERRGLLRFHEWPSGHFQVTEAGRDFLAEQAD